MFLYITLHYMSFSWRFCPKWLYTHKNYKLQGHSFTMFHLHVLRSDTYTLYTELYNTVLTWNAGKMSILWYSCKEYLLPYSNWRKITPIKNTYSIDIIILQMPDSKFFHKGPCDIGNFTEMSKKESPISQLRG